MDYTKSTVFPFILHSPTCPSDLAETIYYFYTRREAQEACNLMRRLMPDSDSFYSSLAVFMAVYSDSYDY